MILRNAAANLLTYLCFVLKKETIHGGKHLNLIFFHPTSRFGDGYTIILRLADTKPDAESCPIDAYMRTSFPSIELKERHQSILQYQLPSHACCLARIFDVLANNYEELGVVDFSVSQTTLDQVRMRMQQK